MNENQMTPTDRFALRLVDFVSGRPWTVMVLTLVLAVAAASGVRFLEFSNNYRVFFSEENPELVAFEEFQATYTKNDNILFVLQPPEGGIFDSRMAAVIEDLTTSAWQIPYAIRVDSVTNFQHTWADQDDLTVEDLVRDAPRRTDSWLDSRQSIALSEPLLAGNLISPDADTTGVNVTLQYPEESLTEVPEAVAAARALATELEADYPGLVVAISGLSMLNNAFAESGEKDAGTLMPLMFIVLVVFMVISLRSGFGTVATLSVVALSAVTGLGLAGHIGMQLTPISVTGPVIIMTLAIADSIHILITLLGLMREGQDKRSALRESLRINFLAVVITSVTTIVGFLTLNFSDAPPFRDLGNLTAMGIAAALVYSLCFLPALVTALPLRVRKIGPRGSIATRSLDRFGAWVTGNYKPVLATTALGCLLLVAAVPFVDLNDEWLRYFDYRLDFRTDSEFGVDNLNGIYRVEFSVPAGEAEGINDPEYLRQLERLTVWLRERPEVTHVFSYTDIAKRLNKNMHGDDPAYYRLPERRDLAAQYLLLYELSLPFGLDLNDRVSVDKSATRVSASIATLPTRETREFLDQATAWIETELPTSMHTRPTGASVMFSYISQRNIESMLRGNVIAVVLIAIIMMLALRSVRMGALSLLPNALPVLMTFGVWAILVGKVGMAAATVSASSLGIIVDDTVHFLSKYLRARRERGYDAAAAIRYAFRTVGTAIITTTVILTAGFMVLAASTFRINYELGMLTSIAMVLAVLTDFLFLPALLMWLSKSPSIEATAQSTTLSEGVS